MNTFMESLTLLGFGLIVYILQFTSEFLLNIYLSRGKFAEYAPPAPF